jgi:hypothetical protein
MVFGPRKENTMNVLKTLVAVSALGTAALAITTVAGVASAEDTASAGRATVSLHVDGMT